MVDPESGLLVKKLLLFGNKSVNHGFFSTVGNMTKFPFEAI